MSQVSGKRWGAKSRTGTSESRVWAKMPAGDPRESQVLGLAEEQVRRVSSVSVSSFSLLSVSD